MGYRASHKLYAGATTDVILKALGEMVDQYNKWFADRGFHGHIARTEIGIQLFYAV